MTMINDEILMAYADGELDAPTRAAVEAAIAADPQARALVERHRALRATIAGAYADTLDEPVPQALLAAVQRRREVVDYAAAREKRQAQRRWSMPNWAAIAATLAVGVVAGQLIELDGGQPLIATDDGALVAEGALAEGLSNQLASAGSGQPIQVGLSFRNGQADYCRTFSVESEGGLAGIACRAGDGWAVRMAVASGTTAGGGYRMAGSATPPAVLQAVDAMIAGEPLDAEQEAAAKARGWR